MGVTLRVVGAKSHELGELATRFFSGSGTIGRADSNDWVLPDRERFISSQHAEVVARSDGFYIVDKSINGTFLNSADQPIGHGNSRRLSDGDRIRIGEYEIVVSLAVEAATGPGDFWPGVTPEPVVQTQPSGWTFPSVADPLQSLTGGPSVDPLDLVGGAPKADLLGGARGLDPLPGPEFRQPTFDSYVRPRPVHDPSIPQPIPADPFDQGLPAPSVSPGPAASAAGGIPEDWDKTTMPGIPRATSAPPAWPAEPPAWSAEPPAWPSEPARPGASGGDPLGELDREARQTPEFQGFDLDQRSQRPAERVSLRGLDTAPGPIPAGARLGAGVPPDDGAAEGGLEAVFVAAGFDPVAARALATAENAVVVGSILRVVVQGTMEFLSARAEIKNQFRVAMTQIAPVENNPLKFSVNPLDAMQRLFVQHTQGFLGPVAAFEEAFHDSKAHQLAMMAGMRAAFDHLMERFDPHNLQKGFDRELRRSALLQSLNKTKYWDMLIDLYEDINKDSDVNFQRLFGDEFARAYEEQMARLGRGR